MTVSGTTNRNQYTGNGSTTVFARTFLVTDLDHLKVYTTTDGVTSEVTSGITKDGEGAATGNVTFDTAPASGVTVTLIREVPLTQETDYVAQGAVSAETIESDLDLSAMRLQDLQEELDRSLKVSLSSSLENLELPTPSGGAVIGWNATADGLANLAALDGEVPVSAGTDNAVMRYDNGSAGLQDSGVVIDDSDNVTGVANLTMTGTLSVGGTTFTAAGLALMDDASATAQIATLGIASATLTMTNKTLTAPTITAAVVDTETASWTGAESLDPANGSVQEITLTGNVTTLNDNLADGESVILHIDDGSAYEITWPTITWVSGDGTEPTLQTTADTVITIWKAGTALYGFASNGA